MISHLRKQKGFTLIELLIVITIIGILAVALVPRLTGGQGRARDAQRKADLQQIATALEFYADDHSGSYPTADSCVDTLALSSYLTTIPSDPSEDGHVTGCSDYYYYALDTDSDTTDAEGYLVVAKLETLTDTGDSVYQDGFAVTSTDSAADNYTSNASITCENVSGDTSTGCDAGSHYPIYIVGR